MKSIDHRRREYENYQHRESGYTSDDTELCQDEVNIILQTIAIETRF